MDSIKTLGVLLAIGLCACTHSAVQPSSATATPDQGSDFFGLTIRSQVLSNGMQVLVISDPSFGAVAYQTWVRAGTIDESWGKTGVAHLIEYLMFQGTEKFPDQPFFRKLEAYGSQVGASTSRDYTLYYNLIPKELLDTTVELEADRIRSVRVNDADWVRQAVLVSLEEHRLKIETSPAGKIQEALWSLALRRHPYRAPLMGYVNDLLVMNPSSVSDFYQATYHPKNVTVVVAGNIDSDQVIQKLDQAYSSWKVDDAPKQRSTVVEPEQNEERRRTIEDPSLKSRMSVAYPVVSAFDSDCWATDVLAEALFGDEHSLWNTALVDQKKVFLSLNGQAITPFSQGLMVIDGLIREGVSASQALAHLDAQITALVQLKHPSEALIKAVEAGKRRLEMQLLMQVRSPSGAAQAVGLAQVIAGQPFRATKDWAQYRKITPEQVLEVAKQVFDPNRRSVVAGGAL